MDDFAREPAPPAVRRWLSPGSFALAGIMFFLPWLDVSCNGRSVLTQTGLQACTGDVSLAKEFQEMKDKQAPAAPGGKANPIAAPAPDAKMKDDVPAAPLMV